MSLAHELAETNDLLRKAVHTPPPREPATPISPLSREPARLSAATCLLAAERFMGLNILGEHFRDVPAGHVDRRGKDATVSCTCGSKVELCFGQLAKCSCERLYWNGATMVKWAPPASDEAHECRPEQLRLRSGRVVIADYCVECGADLG